MRQGPERGDSEAEIKDAATRWVMLRMDPAKCIGETEESFRDWLAASPRHEHAFRNAERALKRMASPGVFDEGEVGAVLSSCRTKQGRKPLPLRFFWPLAAVAAIVLSLLLFLPFDSGEKISTRVAELRENRLADGTLVSMDAGTRIRFYNDEAERRVVLLEGALVLDIAPGDARPFSVEVGDTVIRDMGTIFSVKKREGIGGDFALAESVEVAVEEGIVDVYDAGDLENPMLRLREGEQTAVPMEAPSEARVKAPIERLAGDTFATWREGRIHYSDRPLAEVLADLQRRYGGEISIEDAELAAMEVSGTLRVDRLEDAMAALQRILPLEIVEFSDEELILERSGKL